MRASAAWRLVRRCRFDGACFVWTGAKNHDGRGMIRISGRNQIVPRASYKTFVGPIPSGMLVLHTCDNPSCANPEHLFLGTQKTNMEDCSRKGRVSRHGRGGPRPRVTQAQLDEAKAIYESGAASGVQLAERLGLSNQAFYYYKKRRFRLARSEMEKA